MRKIFALLLPLGLGACEVSTEPEIRNKAPEFAHRADWVASAAPVGTATVRAEVGVKQFSGSRMDVAAALTGGVPGTTYQWRIFRGDCSVTTAAPNSASPTGLLLFATVQSYPNIVADGAGAGSVARNIAGALDDQTAYSVRFRVAQTSSNWNGTNPIACGNLQRK